LIINGAVNTTKFNSEIINNATNNFTVNNLNGTYNWSVICYDNTSLHMSNYTANRTLYVDPVLPIPIILTANWTWFNSTSPNITFNITDNLDSSLNYTFYLNSTINANGTATNGVLSWDLLESITTDGSYLLVLQAFDDAGNYANSSNTIIYVDTTKPNINLTAPESGQSFNSTSVQFNFTATDNLANYLMCNLTISNGMNETNINATSGSPQSFTKSGFVSGTYYWNVSCLDIAHNRNTSETRNFTINAPDLVITSANISFNDSQPEEGHNLTIYANVFNIGGTPAYNVIVQFWRGDPDAGGVRINGNLTISTLAVGDNMTVAVNYSPILGYNEIFVVVDPPTTTNGSIAEENESNNRASSSFFVGLYQTYAGNTSGLIQLEKGSINKTIYVWDVANLTGSNIFVTDLEATPNFFTLQAIGRNTTNETAMNDFTDVDTKLGSTNYTDSINNTYTLAGAPKEERLFNLFSKPMNNVPVINSTNTSNFKTGMVWDTSDGGVEYNGTQDLIFISEINQQKEGSQGTYDFEVKVPALLRNYNAAGSVVAFYTELK
jgi:hypothetical protein